MENGTLGEINVRSLAEVNLRRHREGRTVRMDEHVPGMEGWTRPMTPHKTEEKIYSLVPRVQRHHPPPGIFDNLLFSTPFPGAIWKSSSHP